MSNRHIDDVFRQALENHEVSPPFRNWDEIQHHLPKPKPFYFQTTFKAGMAALFVLVAGISTFSIQQHLSNIAQKSVPVGQNKNDQTINALKSNDSGNSNALPSAESTSSQSSTNLLSNSSNVNNSSLSNNTTTLTSPLSNSASIQKQSLKANKALKKAKTGINQSQKRAFETAVDEKQPNIIGNANDLTNINSGKGISNIPDDAKSSNIASSSEPVTQLEGENVEYLPKSDVTQISEPNNAKHNVINAVGLIGKPKKNRTNGLYFGSFYGVHVSRLLNNQALNATKNVEDLQYRMHSGHSYGFVSGYDFSSSWGIQTEWTVKSLEGQNIKYKPLESVTYRETQINLTYTNVPVLVKYRFTRTARLTKQPTTLNLLAGVQYGVLKSAEINLNNPTIHSNLLKKSTWGIIGGLDYDVYLSRNYFLSFGARAGFATSSNSFTHVELPDKNSANHLLLGLRASFNYRFVH